MRNLRKYITKGKPDMVLVCILATMIVCGLVMIFSASAPSAYYQHGNQYYFVKKQFMWTLIGVGAMLFTSSLNYKVIKQWSKVFCVVSLVLMILVPVIGIEVNGAKRWLGFGGMTFQPSEIAKFALILYFARRISEQPKNHLRDFAHGVGPYLLILGAFIAVMILQKHLSAIVVTFATVVVILVAAGANIKHFAIVGIIGVLACVMLVLIAPYRMARITAFMDPFADIQGSGWQIVQGLYAIGSGGIFGRGLGRSRQKFLYVPEAHNDYIYAILCEELGLVGAICLMVLFVAFLVRCIQIAERAPDKFSKISVFGITTLIAFQYIINLGVVTSTIPNTGMQLPFFSAGGSSFVFLMAAMGVVLSISKKANLSDKKEGL